jgi:hypothetical protein
MAVRILLTALLIASTWTSEDAYSASTCPEAFASVAREHAALKVTGTVEQTDVGAVKNLSPRKGDGLAIVETPVIFTRDEVETLHAAIASRKIYTTWRLRENGAVRSEAVQNMRTALGDQTAEKVLSYLTWLENVLNRRLEKSEQNRLGVTFLELRIENRGRDDWHSHPNNYITFTKTDLGAGTEAMVNGEVVRPADGATVIMSDGKRNERFGGTAPLVEHRGPESVFTGPRLLLFGNVEPIPDLNGNRFLQ